MDFILLNGAFWICSRLAQWEAEDNRAERGELSSGHTQVSPTEEGAVAHARSSQSLALVLDLEFCCNSGNHR